VAYLSMDEAFASEISKAPHDRDDTLHIGLLPGLVVAIGSLTRVPSLAFHRAWLYPHLSPWRLFPVQPADNASGGTTASITLVPSGSVTLMQRAAAAVPAFAQGCVQAVVGVLAKPLAGALDTISLTCISFEDAALAYLVLYVYLYTHLRIYMCTYICICAYTYVYVYTYIYVYIYTYIYVCTCK